MWLRKDSLLLLSVTLINCGFCIHLPSNYRQIGYSVPIVPIVSPHFVVQGNRDDTDITDIYDLFSPDYWFPIEINVPDTVMSAWDSFGAAWSAASDYFSMGEEGMERHSVKFIKTHHIN